MPDFVIIGGGVVGLSLAYELAIRGHEVRVLDRQQPGREASWAGAGILPPSPRSAVTDPVDQLRAISHRLHPEWAARLRAETGIDTGFRECGGIYLARSLGEAVALQGLATMCAEFGIEMHRLSCPEIGKLEPALMPLAESGRLRAAYLAPAESQLRNPEHLRALVAACLQRGVAIDAGVTVQQIEVQSGRIAGIATSAGLVRGGSYCVASGAWSFQLLQSLGIQTGILPIRGQIVMYRCQRRPFSRVINEGPRYLVPRDDGRVLVGSTEEEAGFDKTTTEQALAELRGLACALVPELERSPVEKSWAGLRPGSFDGLPYLGRLPDLENGYVAAGHFRNGLHLSTGTARVMAQLMTAEPPEVDLSPFQVCRGAASR